VLPFPLRIPLAFHEKLLGQVLRRTFAVELKCHACGSRLRLLALIKTEAVIKKILIATHLPADAPELHSARPPPGCDREAGEAEDLVN